MNSRQLAYLKALDIDVWQRREHNAVSGGLSTGDSLRSRTADGDSKADDRSSVSDALTLSNEHPNYAPAATSSHDVSGLNWDELKAAVSNCTLCPLHTTRTQAVFGVGDRHARWMVIGEAPGAEEDRQGEPFVGRAGQLLNSMLKAIGLAREQVFIANILKSRPPSNRDPRPEEVRACIPYLFRQIELIDPQLILCVGRIAAQTLLQSDSPIGKLRGRLHRIAANRPMIVTYHPAYLLRSPAEKRKAWSDLMLAVRTYETLQSGGAV